MDDVRALIDRAKSDLCEGNYKNALDSLTELEAIVEGDGSHLDAQAREGLVRVAELARAAAEGLADARNMIDAASRGPDGHKTYDGGGREKKLGKSRMPLGRY